MQSMAEFGYTCGVMTTQRLRSRDRVLDEALRRRLAPLRAEPDFDRVLRGAAARVQHVGVGPVLVHAPPRVFPVVEDLAAEQMPADAPDVPVARGALLLVADHEVFEALHLERQMVEPDVRRLEAEERVMVDERVAAVAAVERSDEVVGRARVDLVRRQKTEHLAVPADLLLRIPRHENRVRDAFDLRRAALDAEQLAR